MAKIKQLKTNFVSGEIDPTMVARTDIKFYHNAARKMRNVVAIPQGGFSTRPGSVFVDKLPAGNIRLAPFQYTTDEAYLFVFTNYKVIIYYRNNKVAEVATPYSNYDLVSHYDVDGRMIDSGINFTQTLSTMIIYHEKYAPRIIKRGASHSSWTTETAIFDNIPNVDFGDRIYTNGVNEVQRVFTPSREGGGRWLWGDTFSLMLEDEETAPISMPNPDLAGSSATLAEFIQNELNLLPNVSFGDITVVSEDPSKKSTEAAYIVTFSGKSGHRPWGAMGYKIISSGETPTIQITVTTRGVRPGEDAISSERGWPRCGVFFQGRHWMAGSKSLPNTIFATRSATDWDLNNKKLSDDYGFMYSSDTDDVPIFLNIYAGRHLQFFSTAGEFYVPISDREGITPNNMALRRTTSRGMRAGTRVAEVDGATVFIHAQGKTLFEFIFADTEAAYQANSISLLASHLMRNPVSLAMRKSTSTSSADLMMMPNVDGTMTVLCTIRTQEVNAFTLWETDGAYVDACSVYDDMYAVVTRTINGVVENYIEQFDEDMPVDCGAMFGAASQVSLPWLPNSEVAIILDDAVQEDQVTDGSGKVIFDRPSIERSIIGLKWPEVDANNYPGYRWLVETLPPEADLQDGTTFGRKRRIVEVAFRMHNTNGLMVNNSRVAMRRYGGQLLDRPNPRVTDIYRMKGFLGWDYEGKVSFGETEPTQSTVLALSWAVSF